MALRVKRAHNTDMNNVLIANGMRGKTSLQGTGSEKADARRIRLL